ncbi:MAG: 6-phosphogluconolactonase [Opitutaceae bacterium]
MTETPTPYGRLVVGTPDVPLHARWNCRAQHAKRVSRHFTWAPSVEPPRRTGFAGVVARKALSRELIEESHFTVSDERMVPLNSDQSTTAVTLLSPPAGTCGSPASLGGGVFAAAEAAEAYRKTWFLIAGPGKAYDVCMLGMGDDAHTACSFWDCAAF